MNTNILHDSNGMMGAINNLGNDDFSSSSSHNITIESINYNGDDSLYVDPDELQDSFVQEVTEIAYNVVNKELERIKLFLTEEEREHQIVLKNRINITVNVENLNYYYKDSSTNKGQ